MAKFCYPVYYPDGKIIKNEKMFMDFYSNCYYMNNNVFVEKKIKEILAKGKDDLLEEDIFNLSGSNSPQLCCVTN